MLANGDTARPRPARRAVKGMCLTLVVMKNRPSRSAVDMWDSSAGDVSTQTLGKFGMSGLTAINALSKMCREGVGKHAVLDCIRCPHCMVAAALQQSLETAVLDR